MKYITTQQEMVDYIRELFRVFNHEFYDGRLRDPVINVGTLMGMQKSRYIPSVWVDAKEQMPEIIFDPSFLGDESITVESIAAELLHCMVHQYCDENGIKCSSNRGAYHNKKFKEVAEHHGLKSIGNSCGKWWGGYKDYAIEENSVAAKLCKDLSRKTFIKRDEFTHGMLMETNCSTRKLICPCCGQSVRATRDVNILCGDCMKPMVRTNLKYYRHKT